MAHFEGITNNQCYVVKPVCLITAVNNKIHLKHNHNQQNICMRQEVQQLSI